jgi:hypothetical protein
LRQRQTSTKLILPASAKASFRHEAPPLASRHVEPCVLLPDRNAMIRNHLPKYGVVAEIGVAEGGNARTILQTTQPRELHLIDMTFAKLEHVDPAAREGGVDRALEDRPRRWARSPTSTSTGSTSTATTRTTTSAARI